MPPKKKEEVVDLSTLPPWLSLSVYLSPEASEQNAKNILKGVYESNFSIKKLITRDEIIDYGKKNGMYLDPAQDKQKKDKNAAEIPTELTPELLAKMFSKFYEEINLEERKEKKARLDAIAEGKDPASLKKADAKKTDPKAAKDAKKGGKDAPKPEEVKEEPLLDTLIPDKKCDYVYFLVDYPTTKAEVVELSKQGGRVDLVLALKEKIHEAKEHDGSALAGQEEDEETMRNRLENFMGSHGSQDQIEGQSERREQRRAEEEERKAKDREYINHNVHVTKGFRSAREESKPEEPIRNMVILDVPCEFNEEEETPEESLKNITRLIYEEVCRFSNEVVEFKAWIQNKKTQPIKQTKKPEPEPIKVEATEHVEEPIKSPPGKGGKGEVRPTSKEAGKDVKKGGKTAPGKKEAEEEKKEEAPKPEPPKVEEKEVEFTFNFYEKQLNPVKEEHLTPGALLEALVDEISHNTKGAKPKPDTTKNDIENIFKNFDDELLRGIASIKPAVKQATLNEVDMSNPYHYIINEGDIIALKSQEDQLASQEPLAVREHLTFDRLKLPGFDRNEMPSYPEKSEPIRKAEKSQVHPFLSFEISDFERFQSMELFEKLLQENGNREFDFGDRVYEERFNANILRQKLYQALLFDPETYIQYNDKEDSLLLGVYYKNPPGRVIRKKWTNPWKVLPNIENWILYFKENENNNANSLFYNLDYHLVENLHEVIKFMYPNDLSVIMCSQFKVGEHGHNFYRILKENFVFGIRKSVKADNPNSELWAVLENRTKLLVEVEKLNQNENVLKGEVHKNDDAAIENQVEGEKPAGEEEAASARVETGPVNDVYGATFTLTLQNGLIVKFLTNGDILQTIAKTKKTKEGRYFDEVVKEPFVKEDLSEQEKSRLITGKGSVIRYMKDGSIQILYANGNYAFCKKNSGTWITTNNKGLRRGRRVRDNSEYELDPIPSARKTDPETGCKILIREDKVMVIRYPDGTVYTTHKDGTRFLTSPDSNTIVIEHNDFATVRIKYDPVKARMGTIVARGSSTAYQGFENIMDRSFDGRVTETFLPDGSKVVGYKEKRELEGYETYEVANIHLLYEPEGSVFRFKSTGEVILVSANDRFELNRSGENRETNDIDYFLQLYGIPEERKNGVYTAELSQNVIWTRDNENNFFSISSNGETKGKIAVSFDLNQNVNEPDKPIPNDIPDGLYIEQENNFLPPPEFEELKVLPPRLFIVKNDNTGSEYLNDLQLTHYFRTKDNDPKCTKMVDDQVPGFHNCQSLTYLTSFSNYDKDRLKLIFVKIPNNVDIIPQTETIREEPLKLKFLYRNLLKFTELDEVTRQRLHEDLEKFTEWKKNQAKEAHEFGVKERSEEQKEKEFSIQQKIVESRRTTRRQENYQDCIAKVGYEKFPKIYDDFRDKLILSRKRKDSEHIVVKTRKSITKNYLPLQKPPALPEEIYPLGIRFSEADWRDVKFVEKYYHSYPGMEFEKTLPKYDIPAIIQAKDKLRKTQNLMQSDDTLKEGGVRKYSLPRSNPEMETASPVEVNKEREFRSPELAKTTAISPSWNMTRDRLKKEREDRDALEARTYHGAKSPDFDVYGKERDYKGTVPTLLRPEVQKELNARHIAVESATDRRIKISSMAPRLHLQAPSVEESRRQGTHTLVYMAQDRKYNLASLQEKKDLMTTAEFADPLRKDLLITPGSINFGKIKYGTTYERTLAVKNEDANPQRINVPPTTPSYINVRQKDPGAIAMGVTRYLIVTLDARKENVGVVNCEVQIKSKHDIYKIPITAEILNEQIGEKNKLRSKLAPINQYDIGTVKVNDLSDSKISQGDTSFPSLRYDRNTKLDMNLHNQKKKGEDDSFRSDHM